MKLIILLYVMSSSRTLEDSVSSYILHRDRLGRRGSPPSCWSASMADAGVSKLRVLHSIPSGDN